MTTIVDGTTGITYPTIAGGTSAVQASSSKVLQVISSTTVGSASTTSTSYGDVTNATVTITPSNTSSKILVLASGYMLQSLIAATNINMYVQLVRGSTAIVVDTLGYVQNAAGGLQASIPFAFTYLDSPSTTSATTYKIQQKSSQTSTALSTSNVWIIVQEIAG